MSEPVAVRVRDCECPGAPHAEGGDLVYIAPTPSLACGLEAQADIIEAAGSGAMLRARWQVTVVRHGAVGWNLLDVEGAAMPFDLDALLADYGLAAAVAERCDELYGDVVMRPLLRRLGSISPSGPMGVSTSHRNGSTPSPRKRSSPATTAATVPSGR